MMRIHVPSVKPLTIAAEKQVKLPSLSLQAPCGCVYKVVAAGGALTVVPWGLCRVHNGDSPIDALDMMWARWSDPEDLSDEARKSFIKLHRVQNVHE